jgi:uncharacterized coiled-coil protein SlyX
MYLSYVQSYICIQFERGTASHNDDINSRLQQLEHCVAQQNSSIDNLKSVVVAEQQQSIQVCAHSLKKVFTQPMHLYCCDNAHMYMSYECDIYMCRLTSSQQPLLLNAYKCRSERPQLLVLHCYASQ